MPILFLPLAIKKARILQKNAIHYKRNRVNLQKSCLYKCMQLNSRLYFFLASFSVLYTVRAQ